MSEWEQADEPARRSVPTGHADGVITLNVAESLGEPYRTVVRHIRHELRHRYGGRARFEGNAVNYRKYGSDFTMWWRGIPVIGNSAQPRVLRRISARGSPLVRPSSKEGVRRSPGSSDSMEEFGSGFRTTACTLKSGTPYQGSSRPR
jgi:hypothetical protein